MFKLLMYYSAYDKLVEMVSDMKKIGIDVSSHQTPTQVLSQTIEFNADFIIFETGKQVNEVYQISEKLQHLLSPPSIILIKKEDEILNSNSVMKANVIKVFSEPIDSHQLIAYLLEVKGFDPTEYFNKYLKVDYKPKKTITPQKIAIDKKFSERDYLNSFTEILESVESDEVKSLSGQSLDDFKSNIIPVNLDEESETERDRFMMALLTGKPID